MAWNRTVSNLISKNDEGRIVARHVVESLEHAAWLRESGCDRWLDFGSGAGFPAIPLVIVGIGSRWTLVESRRIKTLFLRKILRHAARRLDNGLNARLEHVVRGRPVPGGSLRGSVGGETLARAATLVDSGGSALKGSRWRAEMKTLPGRRTGLSSIGPYRMQTLPSWFFSNSK
jgi:16S rRNA G527 N7-methylase RsmG